MSYLFQHVNFNVKDLQASISFYKEALDLVEDHRIESSDDSFIIVYLRDERSSFQLELTWLRDHPQAYDLGESEFHLALQTDDFEQSLKKHKQMGCVCMENSDMGIYFINDPDEYWIEIVPK